VQHVSSRRLRLTETISLGEKRSVSIIEVDGAQYLIGSSAGSVQLLTVLEKQDGRDSRRTEARAS
jgi:flagellar biogenesis protein FliO